MRLKITDAPYFVKIPVRLKISVGSKNFGTSAGKPSGVVQVFRTYERIAAPDAKQESDKGRAGEDAGTHDHRRRAGEQQTNKFFVLYIGIEKYLQKVKKKFAGIEICCTFAPVIKNQTS